MSVYVLGKWKDFKYIALHFIPVFCELQCNVLSSSVWLILLACSIQYVFIIIHWDSSEKATGLLVPPTRLCIVAQEVTEA